MRKIKLLDVSLCLFDGTGDNGASGAVGNKSVAGIGHRDDAGASDATHASSATAEAGSSSEINSGDGEKAPFAGEKSEAKASKRERRAGFRKLVEGEYKDIYEGEIRKALNGRFEALREKSERLDKVSPLIEALAARYDVGIDDIEGLQSAINSDSSYWEAAAEDAGMTVSQYQEYLKYKSDSRRLEEFRMEREREASIQQKLREWNDAAEEVRASYPEFDISEMAQNSSFMNMLRAGVPMKHAYEVINLEGVKANAAKSAAAIAEKNVVEGIRAKGQRPHEVGTSSQTGITTGKDISKLDLDGIKDALERARRGENVTFR